MISHHHCFACLEHGCLLFSSKQLLVESSVHIGSMLSGNSIACDAGITAQYIEAEDGKASAFHIKLCVAHLQCYYSGNPCSRRMCKTIVAAAGKLMLCA